MQCQLAICDCNSIVGVGARSIIDNILPDDFNWYCFDCTTCVVVVDMQLCQHSKTDIGMRWYDLSRVKIPWHKTRLEVADDARRVQDQMTDIDWILLFTMRKMKCGTNSRIQIISKNWLHYICARLMQAEIGLYGLLQLSTYQKASFWIKKHDTNILHFQI